VDCLTLGSSYSPTEDSFGSSWVRAAPTSGLIWARSIRLQDEASGRHVSLPYAAISVEVAATANAGDTVHEASELAPPPEVGRREDFRVGSARALR
jgi:hypothetical protein